MYAVVNNHSTFGDSFEFSSLSEARKMCDSERREIGGNVHIYKMRDATGVGNYVLTDDIVPHKTGQRA